MPFTASAAIAAPWREVELTLTAARDHPDPYNAVEVWADFVHSATGRTVRRPAFWDGGHFWRVRFAAPVPGGAWEWRTASNVPDDAGLHGVGGTLPGAETPEGEPHRFYRRGFWRMSPGGGRNLVHAGDGMPCLLAGDTAWALPWRATEEQARVYAADRRAKGFNAALLMTVQPDMRATGPRSRTEDEGFGVGFEDLPDGRLTRLNPEYFQYFDRLTAILVEHEIVPVYQPVFHGYGWKGLSVAGPVVPSGEYARYCRYLVARYGARPAVWLIGGDGKGDLPQVGAGGEEVEAWDAYAQPTGIHYRPHADNRAYQDAAWLDFQWCQSGHNGEHIPERVADMWRNLPPKAVANGEPTYENIGKAGNGAGWWQGHEAWCNLCAGGTMGVVYGAGSLWQWKLHLDEPGHQDWCQAPGAGWREALDFEGSRYVGVLSRIFDGLPFAEMAPDWTSTIGRRGLSVPGRLLIVYLPDGGGVTIADERVPLSYRVVDPKTGGVVGRGERAPGGWANLPVPEGKPRVLIFSDTFVAE
jgi:hypothetical protein